MNRTLYSIFFYLALPLVLLKLWRRGSKAPAYRQRIGERFAFGLPQLKQGGIWLHTVSVGESIAAAPLVKQLQQLYPELPITITCMTPTGSERIRSMFGDSVQHCYLPYDLPCRARKFFNLLKPRLGVVMETELWPNHIQQCAKMEIPVVLANARLSERSARGYAKFPKLTAPMLAQLSGIAVQTPTEAERFLQLGARKEAVQITGSIKFDLNIDQQLFTQAEQFKSDWQPKQRLVWIAASTHIGEDEHVLAAHKEVLQQRPDALLILVPRHPERFDSVYQLCVDSELNTLRRSASTTVEAQHQVLLGDSMGEMLLYYAVSDLAFVGGSLVEHGGHNVLEPAALGKPVLSGPHVFNFLDIVGQMREAGALQEVQDASELAQQLQRLWADNATHQQMQAAGEQVLKANQGALQRLLDMLAARLS